MYKIDVKNELEDIEICGSVYQLDLSDDAVKRFGKDSEYLKDIMKNLFAETLNDFEKCTVFCRDFINGMMLNEPFDAIYAGLGNSTVKTVVVIPKLLAAYQSIAREASKNLK